ncbi:LOW QUALITY PROTEIN: inositol 1,4,5-trisphosphate receptor-interacting protein-like 1 [Podargus strigoides]
MAIIVFLTLAMLGIVQKPLQLGGELNVAMHRFTQQCVEQLNWKMIQLLQDIEETQEQNRVAREDLLLAAFWQWVVEDLVDELLTPRKTLSGTNFKPRLPASGMGCVYKGWSACEENVLYHCPTPGHAFHLELGTTEEVSCLHVQLQCIYMGEQLVKDILCFLYEHNDELKS